MNHLSTEYLTEQGFNHTFLERFFSKIEITESCWLWRGGAFTNGYGQISRGGTNGMMLAHRASWIIHFGPIPRETPCVLHDCPDGDRRDCVNPAHLWLGTVKDNSDDMDRKGRRADPTGLHAADQCYMAKVTWEQVREIRKNYIPYRIHSGLLAAHYGLSTSTIWAILRNHTWYDPSYIPVLTGR